jgi:hypothetical protein
MRAVSIKRGRTDRSLCVSYDRDKMGRAQNRSYVRWHPADDKWRDFEAFSMFANAG